MPDELGVEWLTAVVLGAASAFPSGTRPKTQGVILAPSGKSYMVFERIGGTSSYTLYVCLIPSEDPNIADRYGVLKIAAPMDPDKKNGDNNKALEAESFVLKRLRAKSEEVEEKRDKSKHPYPLNYHFFFPELVESFISVKQESRRVNILGFPEVIDIISQLEPLFALYEKERVYVDPKTGAWMLGKTLKTAGFAHEYGIANRFWTESNILFERDLHGITIFDWTKSLVYPGSVPDEIAREEIVQLGRSIVRVLGGDPETGKIPSSEQLPDNQFEQFLGKLVHGGFSDADEAHDSFYKLIWSFWPHEFHPFTTYPL